MMLVFDRDRAILRIHLELKFSWDPLSIKKTDAGKNNTFRKKFRAVMPGILKERWSPQQKFDNDVLVKTVHFL